MVVVGDSFSPGSAGNWEALPTQSILWCSEAGEYLKNFFSTRCSACASSREVFGREVRSLTLFCQNNWNNVSWYSILLLNSEFMPLGAHCTLDFCEDNPGLCRSGVSSESQFANFKLLLAVFKFIPTNWDFEGFLVYFRYITGSLPGKSSSGGIWRIMELKEVVVVVVPKAWKAWQEFCVTLFFWDLKCCKFIMWILNYV